MRHNLLLGITLLTFCSCNAQTFSKATKRQKREYFQETKEFIKYIRTIENANDTILLVDKPNMKEFNECINGLFRDTTLFTKDEQKTIKSQINDPLLKKWDTKLVEKANVISSDTVTTIFKDRNKWWTYFYKHYGRSFNSYSAPIFLRNYTLCLFYSDHSCGGLCGSGQIIIFKKEGDKWNPFKSFCDWIS
jgi:hypothetical protein